LLAQGQTLELPGPPPRKKPAPAGPKSVTTTAGVLTLDDRDAELSGAWTRSANFRPHVGDGYLHDERRSDGKSRATFRFKGPADGDFELRMAYSAHETRTKRLPVTLVGGGDELRFTVDQTQPLPAGETYRTIRQVRLRQGVDYVLTVTNEDTGGFVILDAFQLAPVDRNR
jgi:hypothetical protein